MQSMLDSGRYNKYQDSDPEKEEQKLDLDSKGPNMFTSMTDFISNEEIEIEEKYLKGNEGIGVACSNSTEDVILDL